MPNLSGYFSLCLDPADYTAVAEALQAELPLPQTLLSAVPKRQSLYLTGRYCAREALKQAGWTPQPEITTGPVGEPIWPPGWVGSITHSQTHVSVAIAAATAYRGLGLDNETPMSEKTLQAVKDKISTPSERQKQPQNMSEQVYYTLLFSAKESLYKALYPTVRRFFDFQAAELHQRDAGRFEIALIETLHPELPADQCFPVYCQLAAEQIFTAVLWQTAD
ncbi:MAG: 4'-phosphopantetheinyl transferase superfamily protein [Candidatus Sericytochromatia bacterium]|nr:4'-phosphopantetheinyl transferase superfamily protein [Candidatus Sericytochromatia bacterium]